MGGDARIVGKKNADDGSLVPVSDEVVKSWLGGGGEVGVTG